MNRRGFLLGCAGCMAGLLCPIHAPAEERHMKALEGLRAAQIQDDNLQLGCLKGALEYLHLPITAPWLAGCTAHAFVIHVTPGVCLGDVSSVLEDAYRDGTMARLGLNLGYELDWRYVKGDHVAFQETRSKALHDLRNAIDAGHPCYMYHNFCYQMIGGYDGDGIYFAPDSFPGSNAGQGPVGLPDSHGFELAIVRPANSHADDLGAARDGIAYALKHRELDSANHGLSAYDNWIESIRTAESTGTWRAIRAWESCRRLGVEFLIEAEEKLPGSLSPLLRAARNHYEAVAGNLSSIAERSAAAKTEEVEPIGRDRTASELSAARDAEGRGMEALEQLVRAM